MDAAELAIHGARKVSDPLYALKATKQEFEALAAIARDPVAAFDALGEKLHA